MYRVIDYYTGEILLETGSMVESVLFCDRTDGTYLTEDGTPIRWNVELPF